MQVIRTGFGPRMGSPVSDETRGFAKTLAKAIDAVNQREIEAQEAARLMAAGQISDIHTVTIAAQKAELALDLAVAVRNKVLEAYQEVMRLQI